MSSGNNFHNPNEVIVNSQGRQPLDWKGNECHSSPIGTAVSVAPLKLKFSPQTKPGAHTPGLVCGPYTAAVFEKVIGSLEQDILQIAAQSEGKLFYPSAEMWGDETDDIVRIYKTSQSQNT